MTIRDGTREAEVIKVIHTVALCGEGVEGDPIREVVQYWSLDGELLAEQDGFEGDTGE